MRRLLLQLLCKYGQNWLFHLSPIVILYPKSKFMQTTGHYRLWNQFSYMSTSMHVNSIQFSTDFVGSHGCFGNLFCTRYVLLALLCSYFGWVPPPAHGSSSQQWQRIMYKESNRQGGQVDNRFFVFYALFLTRSSFCPDLQIQILTFHIAHFLPKQAL